MSSNRPPTDSIEGFDSSADIDELNARQELNYRNETRQNDFVNQYGVINYAKKGAIYMRGARQLSSSDNAKVEFLSSRWSVLHQLDDLGDLYQSILRKVANRNWRGGKNLANPRDLESIVRNPLVRDAAMEYRSSIEAGNVAASCKLKFLALMRMTQVAGRWSSADTVLSCKTVAGGFVAYSRSENDQMTFMSPVVGTQTDSVCASHDNKRKLVMEFEAPGTMADVYSGSGFIAMLTSALGHKADIACIIQGLELAVYRLERQPQSVTIHKYLALDEWYRFDYIDDFIKLVAFITFFISDPLPDVDESAIEKPRSVIRTAESASQEGNNVSGRMNDRVCTRSSRTSSYSCPEGPLADVSESRGFQSRVPPRSNWANASKDVWERFVVKCKHGASLPCVRLRDNLDEQTHNRVMESLQD